ncbi:MAG: oligosaccharide flippase family protein [Deltaproteobacteria bacterium]|nr:oligosaccharide flippase family protein [Deltaproteobacteria bacterium]
MSTLLITRYVSPGDYGELSVAVVLVYTTDVLSRFGLFQYFLAKPEADRADIFHATVYNLVLILLGAGLLFAFRWPLGPLFDAPRMALYLPGLALAVVIERFTLGPARILWRDLRYGTVRLSSAAGDVVYSIVTIGFAMAGWGATSVVLGNIARALVVLLLIVRAADRREWLSPTPLRWEPTRRLFAFGLPLSVGSIASFASRRWDNLVISRVFGPAAVGLYNLAYNLAELPASYLGEEMAVVLLPAFARLSPDRRAASLVRSTALLALVVAPAAAGLAAVSDTLVSLLFDARWVGLAPLVAVLALSAFGRVAASTVVSYLPVRDRPGAVMWLEIFKVATLLAGIALSARLGLIWACGAVVLAFTLHALAGMWVVARLDGISMLGLVGAAVRPLLAAGPMVAAVFGVKRGLAAVGLTSRLLSLSAQIATGGLVYVALALVLVRGTALDLLRVVRDALSRRRGKTEVATTTPPASEATDSAAEGKGT